MKILFIILAAIIIITALMYRKDLNAAKKRFASYKAKAKIIETSFGKMSYIDEGKGEPILSCHGITGGYDQAYDIIADKRDKYRVIAPSRFGYPGSDMPDNPSIDNQVEAFCEMLDKINIDKTYVLGTSAGGACAIKFALKHPERAKGLILYSSGYPAMNPPKKRLTYAGPPPFMCHNFAMWLCKPLFKILMGFDSDAIKVILPLEKKYDGIICDAKISNTDMINNYMDYDMANLSVPLLIFHSKDDKLADYNAAAKWAERVSDCTFISFDTGGHTLEGHTDEGNAAFDKFISK